MAPKKRSAAHIAAASKGCKAAAAKHRRTPAASAEEPVLESNGEVQGMLLVTTSQRMDPSVRASTASSRPPNHSMLRCTMRCTVDWTLQRGGVAARAEPNGIGNGSQCVHKMYMGCNNSQLDSGHAFISWHAFISVQERKRRRVDGFSGSQIGIPTCRYRVSMVLHRRGCMLHQLLHPRPVRRAERATNIVNESR